MSSLATAMGTIGILTSGTGEGVPILFLHGVGSDKSAWRPQVDFFGRSRPAVAIDYPGYGESVPLPDATRDDFAAAAFATLDALGFERAHVCGLSLGGVVAIAMDALAPRRCASLILSDTFAVHPEGQAIYDRSVAASASMTMTALATARAPALLGSAASESLTTQVIDTMGRIDSAAYRLGAGAVWLADQGARVGMIDRPTLVLVGEEDRITPPSLSRALAATIGHRIEPRPCVRFCAIERAGHLANLEQPAAFNQAVEQFLAEVEPD